MTASFTSPIDLLHGFTSVSPGIEYIAGEFIVSDPWAAMKLRQLTLGEGWYCLEVGSGDCEIVLQLKDLSSYKLIELSASDSSPAYVHLEGGKYEASLVVGARCGYYGVKRIELSTLSALERVALFWGRGVKALLAGASPLKLLGAASRALRAEGTFGVRSASSVLTELGPISNADVKRVKSGSHRLSSEELNGPTFLINSDFQETPIAGLATQSYRRFTQDSAQPYDAICQVGAGEELTPDALATFARIFVERPHVSTIIADTWDCDYPTTRVGFDPLLYNNQLPTPYAIRRGVAPSGSGRWAEQAHTFAVTGCPLAFASPQVPKIGARPAARLEVPASIIIPTRDRADLLKQALAGLFSGTDWPHEVIVVDNGSVEAETFALFEEYRALQLKVVRADIPFNFSSLCNLGARVATSDYLVFMNNDIELIRPDWLAQMMRLAMQDNIGAVGARLYYADKRLQHGGVALGVTQLCGHMWRGLSFEAQQKVDRLTQDSLRSAVTGALLCVSRARFDAVGGFDESAFPVTLNDIDLCLKLYSKGWFSAYAAGAEAFHHEGESRGQDTDLEKRARRQSELDIFAAKWADLISNDPWLPLAVSRATERFVLR